MSRYLTLILLVLSPLAGAMPLDARLSANWQYDLLHIDGPAAPDSRVDSWRRRETGVLFKPFEAAEAKIEYDFASRAFTDLYLRFPLAGGRVTLGQGKTPFGADFLLSSRQHFLTENATSGLFSGGRRLGLGYAQVRQGSGESFMVYGRDTEQRGPDLGLAGRAFRYRGDAESGLWHGGIAIAVEKPQDEQIRLRVRPELPSSQLAWIDSGLFSAADSQSRYALEGGWQRGMWLLQGEWFLGQFDTDAGSSRTARGGYLQSAWTLRGEPRRYKDGLFTSVPQDTGLAFGQLELVARISTLDVPRNDGSQIAQHSWSLGLNAGLGRNLRLMLDHHHSERDAVIDDTLRVWTLRTALMF